MQTFMTNEHPNNKIEPMLKENQRLNFGSALFDEASKNAAFASLINTTTN
jgi:hypothetical protein